MLIKQSPVLLSDGWIPIALILTILVLGAWLRRDTRLNAIPGPRGHPLVGVGYKLPPGAPSLFRKWAQQYGDVFRLRVGWYDWVVINTPDAISEILEKQAVKTSSKAPSPMSHDIVTGGNRMPTMPYGQQWRGLRSIIRQVTTVPMTASFIPSQEFEAKQLLFDLLTDNENQRNFYQHMRRYAFSIINTTTFGNRVKTWDHPLIQTAIRSQTILRETSTPGAFLEEEFPPLALLPNWLRPGQKKAEKAAKEVLDIKLDIWEKLKHDVDTGKAPHCYAREIYENRDTWYAKGLNDLHLAWVSGGLVEAGFETSAGTLNSLVLYLAANPSVQDKAHAELMTVVGDARLPTFADLASLPYIRACVKEVLRMNPILSPGIRHYADEDVLYRGTVIPKGTVLIANTAALHFDPNRFPNPFQFQPERYLDYSLYSSDYLAMTDPHKRDHFTFSTGRRTCPGARLAENSLNIALAGILWGFEIRPPLAAAATATEKQMSPSPPLPSGSISGRKGQGDGDAEEAEMNLGENAWLDAGFTLPKPFAARFVARGEERARVVREEWERAQREGYELRGVGVDVEGVMQ